MQLVWGIVCLVVILTVIVVVHEGGHAVAARLCGARVTEFFVGMPLGPELARRSRRSGIKYGATLALFGGYTKIAGMAPCEDRRAALVLALVNARGRVTVAEVAEVLGCADDSEDAYLLLGMLADWGSIREVWPAGSHHGRRDYPDAYETVARDPDGLTVFDRGHDFSKAGSTRDGEQYRPAVSADEFFASEQARTYQGLGFFKRLLVLVAGVACNIALAFLVFMLYYMIHGVPVGVDPAIAAVEEASPAAEAGMQAGDIIVEVEGAAVDGYSETVAALNGAGADGTLALSYERDGVRYDAELSVGDDGVLGIYYTYAYGGLSADVAAWASLSYIGAVAEAVASLLVPTQTVEVLEESAGVVGIAVLAQDAVAGGAWSVVTLLGMLSLSLGWMNLLPIPPLDGGKVAIELVQAVLRRPVSMAVQGAVSAVGLALFVLLFVYMVVQDVGRLVGA